MESDFDRPWSSRRGVETLDTNTGLVLARTSVEPLAAVLAKRAVHWNRDVLGSKVRIVRNFGWVFRLAGHAWSIFRYDDYAAIANAVDLSVELEVPVIAYDCSDTTGSVGYVFAERGEIRESLTLVEDEPEYFSADGSRAEPDNVFEHVERFFREQEAYEPGVYSEYFFADGRSVPRLVVGAEVRVGNPGFVMSAGGQEFRTVPEFERVDYLAFGD